MQYQTISSKEEFEKITINHLGVMFYFSKATCNVAEALGPKVIKMLDDNFPKLLLYFIDMDLTPDISAQYSVLVEPTILVFFDGKETIRKSRLISIPELTQNIARIYPLAFD